MTSSALQGCPYTEKVEFKKQEGEVLALCKVNVKVQREVKAKVKKEAAARSESEKAEGLKKRGRKDDRVEILVTIGSFLMEHGVKWMVKEGVVCDSCEKREKKCFWRMKARWGKACLACHDLKKSCVAGGAEELETEAGPSKKRKVEEKGKVKAKTGTLVSGVAESVAVDVRCSGCPAGHSQGAEMVVHGCICPTHHYHDGVELEDSEADWCLCQ